MLPRELDPTDLGYERTRPYDTIPLPDHLAAGIALGTIYSILENHQKGTSCVLEMNPSEGLRHELLIRGAQGRMASIPLAREGQDAPTREHREADGRFVVEVKNNADWILRAAAYALKNGFVP